MHIRTFAKSSYLIASRIPPGHVNRADVESCQWGRCRIYLSISKCSLLVFAARLNFEMQFTRFRGATSFRNRSLLVFAARLNSEIVVYSFSRRDFRNCSFLVFAAWLSKLQFTPFRGATFEIAVYSFSPPKPFQIHQNNSKMLTKIIQKCSPYFGRPKPPKRGPELPNVRGTLGVR